MKGVVAKRDVFQYITPTYNNDGVDWRGWRNETIFAGIRKLSSTFGLKHWITVVVS